MLIQKNMANNRAGQKLLEPDPGSLWDQGPSFASQSPHLDHGRRPSDACLLPLPTTISTMMLTVVIIIIAILVDMIMVKMATTVYGNTLHICMIPGDRSRAYVYKSLCTGRVAKVGRKNRHEAAHDRPYALAFVRLSRVPAERHKGRPCAREGATRPCTSPQIMANRHNMYMTR